MLARDLIAKVRKIEIRTRKIVEELTGGAYHSMFKGRGIEFSEVRAYSQNDDIRDIDWNVTARMGSPYIKKYVEERELTVIIAVDLSASTAFGSAGVVKREKMAEAAALLAFSAIRNHDKVGLLLFTDRAEFYLPPRAGRRHVLRLIRELVGREPAGIRTDLNVPLEYLARSQKKRAVIFLISDFEDCGDYERKLKLLNRKHDVAAFRVLDEFEEALPCSAALQLTGSESGGGLLFDAPVSFYAETQKVLRSQTDGLFRRSKVDMVDLRCGEDLVRPLLRFFRGRRLRNRRD